MRTSFHAKDGRPPTQRAAPATAGSDGPAFDANHLAVLRLALLALLTVAILLLLPVIVRGGASGPAWTEPQTRLSPWTVSRPHADAPEPPMSRQAIDPEAVPAGPR